MPSRADSTVLDALAEGARGRRGRAAPGSRRLLPTNL